MSTLYDELGVARDATRQELRRAYRERARQLHPDLNAGPETEEAIRRLNQAWAVLGDPVARRRYDAELDASRPVAVRAVTARRLESVHSPKLTWVLRPSVVLLAVLGLIFIITAYAGPHSGHRNPLSTTPTSQSSATDGPAAVNSLIGKCLLIQPGYDAVIPCGQPNSGQVVAEVAQLSQCPPGSTGYELTGRAQLVCLVPAR